MLLNPLKVLMHQPVTCYDVSLQRSFIGCCGFECACSDRGTRSTRRGHEEVREDRDQRGQRQKRTRRVQRPKPCSEKRTILLCSAFNRQRLDRNTGRSHSGDAIGDGDAGGQCGVPVVKGLWTFLLFLLTHTLSTQSPQDGFPTLPLIRYAVHIQLHYGDQILVLFLVRWSWASPCKKASTT